MRVLAFVLLAALSAWGADVSGKWKAAANTPDGTVEVTLVLHASEGKISGTASWPEGQAAITDGKVEGDKVSITVVGNDFRAVFSGTLVGDDLNLSGMVRDRNIDLPAKRVKE